MSSQKQTTLAGFFGKPKAGPAPSRPSSAASQTAAVRNTAKPLATSTTQKSAPPSSSPASSAVLKTPSSLPASSPVNTDGDRKKRAGSPLKQSYTLDDKDSEDELSPPPDIPATSHKSKSEKLVEQDEDDESMEVDSKAGSSRRRKRKVVYAESNSESSDDETLVVSSKGELIVTRSHLARADTPRSTTSQEYQGRFRLG